MPLAGEKIRVGYIPGQLAGTASPITSDSSTFDDDPAVQIASVTADVIDGVTYRVVFKGLVGSNTAADVIIGRLCEDSTSGTQLDQNEVTVGRATTVAGTKLILEAVYVASATESKTFVVTGRRSQGAGTCKMEADAVRPAMFDVYVSG